MSEIGKTGEREWTFNRRTVTDQEIYVRAASLAEAWAKARRDDVFEASDQRIIKSTYRSIPND